MKYWMVAGGMARNDVLGEYARQHPGKLNAVYDNHPGLLWGGGRAAYPLDYPLEASADLITNFWNEQMGVDFYLAFNNTKLEVKHLADEDCNWLLEQCHRKGNGVIIASDVLRDHVKSNYPKYTLVSSICKVKKTVEEYREALQQFDVVVLHPDQNGDFGLIKQLDVARMEVLVNEPCIRNCPLRQRHYDAISEWVLSGKPYFRTKNRQIFCEWMVKNIPYPRDLQLNTEQVAKLEAMGIRHFKMQGRTEPLEKVERNLRYYIGE